MSSAPVNVICTFTGGNDPTAFVAVLSWALSIVCLRSSISGPVVYCIDHSQRLHFNGNTIHSRLAAVCTSSRAVCSLAKMLFQSELKLCLVVIVA